MNKAKPFNSLKDKLSEYEITSRSFQSGEVYMIDDKKVLFPGRFYIEDKPRMVAVIGNTNHLNDPLIPTVQAIPITTKLKYETPQCLPVSAGTANLDKTSLLKVGLIQPMLKKDLGKLVGQLDPDSKDELIATVIFNLGIGEEDEK